MPIHIIHRFETAAYTCTELQDVLNKELSVSLTAKNMS